MLLGEAFHDLCGFFDHGGITLYLKEEGIRDGVGVVDEASVVDSVHHCFKISGDMQDSEMRRHEIQSALRNDLEHDQRCW